MDAKVVWSKGLSFTGSAEGGGFSLPLGAEPKVGGANDGFRSLELLLVGLAGCTASRRGIIRECSPASE